jgi:hypothetical protein
LNPYVFIVGCPRSGTTLLRRLVDAHPELAIARGTRWIAPTYECRRGLTPEGFVTPRLLERLRDPHRLERLALQEGDLERAFGEGRDVPFAGFVTALFDLYGARHGKRLVGDKTATYVRHLPTLHRLWPRAKFVHIIRDGRDVCLSVLDWGKGATRFSTFEREPFLTAATWWEWHVRLGLEGGRPLGAELYHEVRYESLVVEPERECARLCEFLGVRYDGAMLRFHEGRLQDDSRLDAKRAWRPVTAGLRSWSSQMRNEDAIRFEAAASGLLDELGYERASPFVSDRDLERAAQVREILAEEIRDGQRPSPRGWQAAHAAPA